MNYTWLDAVAITMAAAIVAVVAWSFTGGAMLRNYAECGTIFLCANQR